MNDNYTPAKITINPTDPEDGINIDTGDLTSFQMLDFLNMIQKVFAEKVVKEAQEIVGSDPKDIEKFIDFQRSSGLDNN